MIEKYDYIVRDFTGPGRDGAGLITDDGRRVPQLLPTRPEAIEFAKSQRAALLEGRGGGYDVGRYDEDRRGMYTSELFAAPKEDEEEEGGDEEEGRRTVHVGVDIGAPVGTEVHAFEDGLIHSAGYNPAVGDYGYVVVIKHILKNGPEYPSTVYALYGHLGASFMADNVPGRKVTKGQVITIQSLPKTSPYCRPDVTLLLRFNAGDWANWRLCRKRWVDGQPRALSAVDG